MKLVDSEVDKTCDEQVMIMFWLEREFLVIPAYEQGLGFWFRGGY